MKILLKTTFAIATLSCMLVACDPAKNSNDSNSIDSTSVQTSADSTITVDTAKTADSTMLGDTTAKAGDTITKTVKKTTVVKKSVTKNN
jgi:hypothetical protein